MSVLQKKRINAKSRICSKAPTKNLVSLNKKGTHSDSGVPSKVFFMQEKHKSVRGDIRINENEGMSTT